jgi:uncharacterized protein with PQ loop repeat
VSPENQPGDKINHSLPVHFFTISHIYFAVKEPTMKIARMIALICLVAMTLILIYGFTVGNFTAEGSQLLKMPWGIVSLVDLYAGFSLFSCWIVYREQSIGRSIIWTFLMMVLGFWAGALYTLIALNQSNGDWQRFFHGKRV